MARDKLDIAIAIEYIHLRGGQERVATYLARLWSQRHKVTVYCYDADEEALGNDVTVRYIRPHPRRKLIGSLLFPLLTAFQIRRGHDIILAQGGNCLRANFALFHTCHPMRLKAMQLATQERGYPFRPRERIHSLIRRYIFTPLERRALLRCAGRAFAVSDRLAAQLSHFHKVPLQSISVAQNGVDPSVFNVGAKRYRLPMRQRLGISDRDLVAAFVGGLWWSKGVHLLIQAINQTRFPWHLLIAGSDPDEVSFKAMAQDSPAHDRIHFLGHVTEPEKVYGAADCFVFPTGAEGFGLAVLEAAACGLPIITTAEAQIPGLIDGSTALIVERDVAQIAQALDHFASDSETMKRMGTVAAERAKAFTWQRQAEILEQAFLDYVATRGTKG